MGTTVNGAVSSQSQSVLTGMLAIKNTNDARARTSAVRINARKTESATKKRLNYNHREISGQLLRAKKTQNAANVLTRAKSRLAMLQRQAGTGQYDTKEIANALAHARRMVRCAQLKVRNLREEEQEQKAHSHESSAQEMQKQNEVKRRVAQKEREIKQRVVIEEMQEVAVEKRKHSDMEQKRRAHRNQERSRIHEADIKYIKGMMANNNGTNSSTHNTAGAVLDLSFEASAMAEVQMLEAQIKQQVEIQIEAEAAAEMAMEMAEVAGAVDGSVTSSGSPSVDIGVSGGDVGAAVDVSV